MNTTPSTSTAPSTPVTPSTPSSPSTTPSISSTPHPNSSFAQFSTEQLLQISTWLEKHTYAKVIDLIQEHFDAEISSSALSRFYRRTAIKNLLADTPDTAAAAAEILQFAATNQPRFSAATVQLLEQTEFNLALTCHTKSEDLNRLARINLIICRTRNAAVRERHADIQQTRCALRARELDLKAAIINDRKNHHDRYDRNDHTYHNDRYNPSPSDDMPSTHFDTSPFTDDLTPADESTPTTPPSENPSENSSQTAFENTFKNPTQNASENPSENPSSIISTNSPAPTITFRPFPGMLALPPEVIENNRRHAEKLLSGQIKLPAPGEIPPPRKSTLQFKVRAATSAKSLNRLSEEAAEQEHNKNNTGQTAERHERRIAQEVNHLQEFMLPVQTISPHLNPDVIVRDHPLRESHHEEHQVSEQSPNARSNDE